MEIQSAHSTGFAYKFFPHINYCPCQGFREDVLGNGEAYTCKHVLAAKLSLISGKVTEEEVEIDLFNIYIESIGA